MALIRGQNLTVAFGAKPVLSNVNFTVDENIRTALVGRNGEGKSTFLKLLAGLHAPDSGDLTRKSGLNAAYLSQSVPIDLSGSVYSVVASGLSNAGAILAEFHALSTDPTGDYDPQALQKLQDAIDAQDAWKMAQKIDETISRMTLSPLVNVSDLSGGMKRRVLLARALVSDPDVLLLDEPTNHLDIGAINWLENYLGSLQCAVVFVTHDRTFLANVAEHIIELDRGDLTHWPANYETYQVRKLQQLAVEAQHNALFDKKLAQEETWIRQGIKARRTRNEGRVRALEAMRDKHRARRTRTGTASMAVNEGERSGKNVFLADSVDFKYNDKTIISDLSITVMRDDRVGIIGPNGCGKSTLINLLLGNLVPNSGTIVQGTQIQIAYFDQLRTALDTHKSAAENVSGGRDMVTINGTEKHIIGYLQDFLFPPDRARAPITALSGGETNRLLLAKLFLMPSNVLILDEPSNDLDVETLELLESLLSEYAGTVILISHDRKLLDNVVTKSLVYQGDGKFIDVIGGYSDFLRELATSKTLLPVFSDTRNQKQTNKTPINKSAAEKTVKNKKPSYKIQKELDELPNKISNLEAEIAAIQKAMSDPEFFKDTAASEVEVAKATSLQEQLDSFYKRWEELES